jgi:two-component sensor histidine kinase
VRGLCRQIGGKLEITNEKGARCSVQFRSNLASRQDHETPHGHY